MGAVRKTATFKIEFLTNENIKYNAKKIIVDGIASTGKKVKRKCLKNKIFIDVISRIFLNI